MDASGFQGLDRPGGRELQRRHRRALERARAADTLYLNGNTAAVQANLSHFAAQRGFDPDELAREAGPDLVSVELPRAIEGADLVSDEALMAVGLPATYPLDGDGQVVEQSLCQDVGQRVREDAIGAISCRCAQTDDGSGRELAWFPDAGEAATPVERTPFAEWY